MKELISALVKAKLSFSKIEKTESNPFHKTKYADLSSVIQAVTPALSEHGLAILQLVNTVEGRQVLETRLYHESGDFISSFYPLPEITDSQKLGAAITYARRYSLCAILSVAPDNDDDDNSLSKTTESSPKVKPLVEAPNPRDVQIKEIRTLLNYPVEDIKDYLSHLEVKQPSQLKVEDYLQLVKIMCLQWALDKFDHPNHAENSFNSHVYQKIIAGAEIMPTVSNWVNHVEKKVVA